MTRRWTPVLVLGALLGAPPTGGVELTLDQAMAMARGQGREVAVAQARVTASEKRLEQAKGYRFPKISLHEIWMRTDSPAEVFALELNQGNFSFDDFVMSDPNNPEPLNNALTRFELVQPIYTGGQIEPRIDQAELASEAAQERAGWVADGAALAAAEAYIMLAQIRERVALLERSMETVDHHVQLAKAYTEQGMLVRSELLRAEVERARIQDLLTEARGQARVAEANLSFRLATDTTTHWELGAIPEPLPLEEGLDGWLATADSRRDLEAARRLLAAGELEAKVKRSGLMPKVGVAARYDLNDENLFGSSGQSAGVMAVASIDLFSGNRHRAARAAAQADAEAAFYEVELFAHGIRLEVREAYEKAITARERHQTAISAQEAAREVERITEERFSKGVVKMIDLVDATTSRREAETRELVARAEAHLASLRLAVGAGRAPETALAEFEDTPSRTES
jgi:outer membrane protein